MRQVSVEVAAEVYRRLSRLHLRSIYAGLGSQLRSARGMDPGVSILTDTKISRTEKQTLIDALESEGRDLFRDYRDTISRIADRLQESLPTKSESELVTPLAIALGPGLPDYVGNDPIALCTIATVALKFGGVMRLSNLYSSSGNSAHFKIYCHHGAGVAGERAVEALMKSCEVDYEKLRDMFGVEPSGVGVPIAIYIDDEDFGAYIVDNTFDEIHCCLASISGEAFGEGVIQGMVTAELVHAFQNAFNRKPNQGAL